MEHVKPVRLGTRRERHRRYWWRHGESRPGMWRAIYGLSRLIATPRVAKHRLFVWLDLSVCLDSAAIAIARDDDTGFGILHSRLHEAWSLRLGTWLGKGKDSRYTPTTTFEIFPSLTASPPTFLPPITPTTRAPEPSPKLREGWWSCAIADSTRRNGLSRYRPGRSRWTGTQASISRRPHLRSPSSRLRGAGPRTGTMPARFVGPSTGNGPSMPVQMARAS